MAVGIEMVRWDICQQHAIYFGLYNECVFELRKEAYGHHRWSICPSNMQNHYYYFYFHDERENQN